MPLTPTPSTLKAALNYTPFWLKLDFKSSQIGRLYAEHPPSLSEEIFAKANIP
jgi:hypothetical protein